MHTYGIATDTKMDIYTHTDSTDTRTHTHTPHVHTPHSLHPYSHTLPLPDTHQHSHAPHGHTTVPSLTPTGTHVPTRPHHIHTHATLSCLSPTALLNCRGPRLLGSSGAGFEDVALMLPLLALSKDPEGGNAWVGGGRWT